MHIVLPLLLLLVLWIHLQVSRLQINLARAVLHVRRRAGAKPIVKPGHQPGARRPRWVSVVVGLDWFYLGFTRCSRAAWRGDRAWPARFLMLVALPWLPPLRRAPAVVDGQLQRLHSLRQRRSYNAIARDAAKDDAPFQREAVVDPSLAWSCGIAPARLTRRCSRARLGAGAGDRSAEPGRDGRVARPVARPRSFDVLAPASWCSVAIRASRSSVRDYFAGPATTELLRLVASVAAILTAAAQADNFDAPRAWTLVAAVTIGYMVSRGSRSPAAHTETATSRGGNDVEGRDNRTDQGSRR